MALCVTSPNGTWIKWQLEEPEGMITSSASKHNDIEKPYVIRTIVGGQKTTYIFWEDPRRGLGGMNIPMYPKCILHKTWKKRNRIDPGAVCSVLGMASRYGFFSSRYRESASWALCWLGAGVSVEITPAAKMSRSDIHAIWYTRALELYPTMP